jgi:ABC-type multidrug transport system fused ATPase/permease subunit
MAFESLSNNVSETGEKAQEFIRNTSEYYKLRLFKSSMKGAISLVNFLILGSFFLLILFFLSLGAAFIIGNTIGKVSLGFFIVAGFYSLVLLLLFIFGKKPLTKFILSKFSELITEEDDIKTLDDFEHKELVEEENPLAERYE